MAANHREAVHFTAGRVSAINSPGVRRAGRALFASHESADFLIPSEFERQPVRSNAAGWVEALATGVVTTAIWGGGSRRALFALREAATGGTPLRFQAIVAGHNCLARPSDEDHHSGATFEDDHC